MLPQNYPLCCFCAEKSSSPRLELIWHEGHRHAHVGLDKPSQANKTQKEQVMKYRPGWFIALKVTHTELLLFVAWFLRLYICLVFQIFSFQSPGMENGELWFLGLPLVVGRGLHCESRMGI